MSRHPRRVAAELIAALTASALLLTACGGSSGEAAGEVTLTVGGKPQATDEAALAVWDQKVAQFEKENPDITIEGSEVVYDPQTFAAQLAGRTLPVVMGVPVTEIQSLINREQLKDVSSYYASEAVLKELNESVTANVQGPDGAYYGVPVSAFTLAVLVNRDVFEEAGLDPDQPLESWDDIAAAASTITEKTDASGLGQLTTSNQGGWTLAATSAAFGGLVEETSGEETTANLDNDATKAALEYLSDLRWDKDVLGSNFLLDFDSAGPAFASGKYGMLVGASEWYNPLVRNFGMDPESYGLFPLPQKDGGLGSLGGGSVSVIGPTPPMPRRRPAWPGPTSTTSTGSPTSTSPPKRPRGWRRTAARCRASGSRSSPPRRTRPTSTRSSRASTSRSRTSRRTTRPRSRPTSRS